MYANRIAVHHMRPGCARRQKCERAKARTAAVRNTFLCAHCKEMNTLGTSRAGKITAAPAGDVDQDMPITFVKDNDRRTQAPLIDPGELYYNPQTKTLHCDRFSGGGTVSLAAGEAIKLTASGGETIVDVGFSQNTAVTTTISAADRILVQDSLEFLKTITGANLRESLKPTSGTNLSYGTGADVNTLKVDATLTDLVSLQASSNDLELQTTTNNEIKFKTNNIERASIGATKLDSSVDINIPIDKHYQINGVDALHYGGGGIILNAKYLMNAVSPYGINLNYMPGSHSTGHCKLFAGSPSISRMTIRADTGKIGVNIDNPTEFLDVVGNIKCSGSFKGVLTGNASTATKNDSITNANIVQLTATQTLTNKTLGNCGNIDTASGRSYYLDGEKVIRNDGFGPHYNCRLIGNESTTASLQDGMFLNYNSTGGVNAHCRFFANSTIQRMHIDASTGHVGIGNNSPGYTLDVGGDCNIASNKKYKMNGVDLSGSNLNYSVGVTLNNELDSKQDLLTFGKLSANSLKLQETIVTNDILLMGTSNVIGKTYAELKTLLQITDATYQLGNNLSFDLTTTPHTINLDAALTGLSIVTSTSFTGELTGNSSTSTKIDSITNNNIVQLAATQTLTNKTLDNCGNIDTASGSSYSLNHERIIYTAGYGPQFNCRIIANETASTNALSGMHLNYNSAGGVHAHVRIYANSTIQRMHIDALNGYVGINNNTPVAPLDVGGEILCGSLKGGQGNSAGNFHIDQNTNNGNMYLNYYSTGFVIVGSSYYTLFDTGNGTHKQVVKVSYPGSSNRILWDFFKKLTPAGQEMSIGALIYNGSTHQVSLVQASDIRLKDNINPIKNHFEILDKLNPVSFAYEENPDTLIDGFIADELYKSYKFSTYGSPGELNEDGSPKMMMIDTKPLIPILTKCIQGNREEIKELEKKNTDLVNKMCELEMQLNLIMTHIKL